MRLIKAKLRGFIGIKEGLGLDEVEVNFEGLEGLVALEGANGMGKTTFLENLQPYRVLASRPGTLKSHCFLKDSFKELTFEMNGDRYRTLIKTDPTTTRSDEGYIYRNGESSSLVDQKVTNYDAFIERLLGSPALFFSSIFCAQNSRKLSDMRPAELKALFAEFLRLDRYIRWEETAKGALRVCNQGIDNLKSANEKLDTKIRMMGDPRNDLKGARTLLKKAVSEIEDLAGKMAAVEKVAADLKKEVIESEQKRQRIEDHKKMIDELQSAQTWADNQFKRASLDQEMSLMDLEEKLANKELILEKREAIEGAVAIKEAATKALVELGEIVDKNKAAELQIVEELRALEDQLGQSRQRVKDMVNDAVLRELEQKRDTAARAVDDAKTKLYNIEEDPQIVRMKADIEGHKKRAAILDDIDPACTSEVCGLIGAAIKARDSLPVIEEQLDYLRKQKQIALETAKNDAIQDYIQAKDACVNYIKGQDQAREKEFKKQAKFESSIDQAKDRLAIARDLIKYTQHSVRNEGQKLIGVEPSAAKIHELNTAREGADRVREDIAKLTKTKQETKKTYTAETERRQKQVADAHTLVDSIKINYEAEKQLLEAENELERLATEHKKVEAEKVRWDTAIPQYEKEIEALEALEEERAAISSKMKFVRHRVAQWDYLRHACSKDGLRAHEIEAVAPMITKNSNDLLSLTFGLNFSVRFQTVDDEGREVLNVIVIGADGSETPLHFKSGGEKVWILKALRLAQTLISQEKSGRHFQTALMDEEDGALSADNAINFIKLYRSFRTMADMDLCLYITHRPEAVAMADSILKFSPGKITIV